jgi:hypothetical protein
MLLTEYINFDTASLQLLNEGIDGDKSLYMKGIFIQGGIKNHNGRIYPVSEIRNAVDTINNKIRAGFSVPGELDHPQELQIHLNNVSHDIKEMWMDGPNGYGKLKVLPTPSGNIMRTLLESGIKLGVSSRGSGEVGDNGEVSGFEMLTVDCVMNSSAPDAYPKPIYEQLMNKKYGHKIHDLAESVRHDPAAQKHLKKILLNWVDSLDYR